jgi:hypothetical protein
MDRPVRSEVAFLGEDWGGDAYPFPIFGFIPKGCFLIAVDFASQVQCLH